MSQPLAGIKVLELSTGVAGPFASKLLADYGADVIKIEPPEGDDTRRHGPFPTDEVDAEQSALFLHLNTNKRGVIADLATDEGQGLVRSLVADTDIVIESFTPGVLDGWSLGWDDLRAINARLVLASITPFGQTGPYAHYQGEEILYYAIGGPMRATGLAEREPVKLAGNLIQYQCGNVASGAILAAHSVAQSSGEGVHLDVSNLETQTGTIDRRSTYLLYHQWTGLNCERSAGFEQRAAPVGMFPTTDGYVQLITMPNWVGRMAETLDDDELRRRFAQPDWIDDEELPDLVDAALYPWTLTRTMAEAARDAQAHKFPVTPLNKPVDLVDDAHFAERGFWVDVEHPVAGTIRQPGAPWLIDDGWAIRRPAPTLGQHTDEVHAEAAPPEPTSDSSPGATPGEQRLPLEGMRVLDLTVVWAGPFATMFLADLGADVIRLDNPYVWPTATRGALPRPTPERAESLGPLAGSYPNFEAGEHPWNRNGMWAAQARNKRGITLDLRTDLGKATFFDLLDQADMVVENNSRDVLDKLGIGWEQIHARNPKAILVRMPPMGASGPYSSYLGFGAHFEALCGMTAIRGYEGADPSTINSVFHMDPATGGAGLFAALCALRRRDQTGVGELVEIPQSENMMQHIGEYLIDAARTGTEHDPNGNRHAVRAPQGCYPCIGDDAWVVVSVGSDEEWAGLRRAMDQPWADDERFATAAGRREHHDDLDELLAAWTSTLTPSSVFHRCQAEGVPAGPVLNEAECLADEHLRSRGFFRRSGSVDLGEWDFVNHLWKWTGPDMVWGPIARLGVDNDDVYRDVLGLDDEGLAALSAEGHLSTVYRTPDGTPL